MRRPIAGLAMLAACALASRADAFCGFYVSGADGKLFNDATQVVLMRDGTRTVLSMQNDYKGPPQDFAIVIPVPVVLQKDNVKTLSPDVLRRVDLLSAPRLVEYWEQDPCPVGIGLGDIGTIGHGSGTGFGGGSGRLGGGESSVKVEAEFSVGEYDIQILSAQDSGGLDAWLRANGYKIPENAEPVLKPYVQAGSKFFVAKVDVARVKFENGLASLSPLRFHYDTDKFELPVKLGLLNSGGTQDLIVHVIAPERYEVANYPNVLIPTNLDVGEAARQSFGVFYAALFDDTLQKHKNAVVTEYAWAATSCDPCPGGVGGITGADLASLGADVMPSITMSAAGASSVRTGGVQVSGKLPEEVVGRIVRVNVGRYRMCYEHAIAKSPTLKGGKVTVAFDIGPDGAVTNAREVGAPELASPDARACMVRAVQQLSFPAPDDKKKVSAQFFVAFDTSSGGKVPISARTTRGNLVLTRLHARYGKDTLGSDLVFRAADHIYGGREVWTDGKLETGAIKSPTSAFQARYAIRHPWTGPIACDKPQRGIWGRPWPDAGAGKDETKSAVKLAYVPRGASLATFTQATGAQLEGATRVRADGDAGGGVVPDAGEVDAGAKAPAASSSRCGCRAVGQGGGAPAPLAPALALALALVARRGPKKGGVGGQIPPTSRRRG